MTNRIEQLRQFVDEDPQDPFNLYALAMEYLKTDARAAASCLDQLLLTHPDYLPTYYQAGNLWEVLGDRARALAILAKGIVLAREQQQLKPMRELQTVYDELADD